MKREIPMPWHLVLDDQELECTLYIDPQGDECECSGQGDSPCHPSAPRMLFGSSDSFDPKFCVTHYFEHNAGDGKTNYKLVPVGQP